jgi:hypothetical protein
VSGRQTGLAAAHRLILACWTVPGLAAEWSLVPSMSTKAYYNDNLLLTPLTPRFDLRLLDFANE